MNVNFSINPESILEAYRPFFRGKFDKRYNIYWGGVGSGKSYFIAQKMIYDAMKNEKTGILVLRKVQATMKSTVIATFKEVLEEWKLDKIVHHQKDKNDNRLIFPNGSFILFKGYDDPEKLKGVPNVTKIYLEEGTDFLKDDLDALIARIRGKNTIGKTIKVYMSFNPVWVGHWLRSRFFTDDNKPLEPENCFTLHTTYLDNKYYGDTSALLDLKIKNVRRWKIDGLGLWGVYGDIIYSNWRKIKCIQDESYYDDITWGLDFGFSHMCGMVKLGIKNNDIYVLKELYTNKLTNSQLAKKIKQTFTAEEVATMQVIADNARPEAIEELNNNGIYTFPCKKGSVLEGIEYIQDRFVFVDEGCGGTSKEQSGYQWQKDSRTGLALPRPVKTDDDLMDSIRYATEKWRFTSSISFS